MSQPPAGVRDFHDRLLARVEGLTFSYPGTDRPALEDVSLELAHRERIALLGPSGGGKSTLLRALAGLVPHFHGGRFAGRVTVAGRDTRRTAPSQLAGTVASVFQDPEDQVVMARVANEVAFGLENVGTPPERIWFAVAEALEALAIGRLSARATAELSGGELQRVCLASALALGPRLLLLDEPTSQLDDAGADALLSELDRLPGTVVLSEQRITRALEFADRVLFVAAGRLLLDAPRDRAVEWLEEHHPLFAPDAGGVEPPAGDAGDSVIDVRGVGFAYGGGPAVLQDAWLSLERGEVTVLAAPNGAGKTTLARVAAGLLEPGSGTVVRRGRVGYLAQDPGRYVVRERVLDEVALAVRGDRARAAVELERVGLGWASARHPRDLSSGERERLALAAVAVAEPDALILDEPTRGVDPVRKAEIARWLFSYAARGRAVLVVTHDRGFPAHRRTGLGRREAVVAVP